MISQKEIKKLKAKLEAEKTEIENDLKKIAKPDPIIKGDWDTNFPQMGDRTSELDENADEVEEYENILPLEYELESRLKNINEALQKIKNRTYGICEKCAKEISLARLKAEPDAKFCIEHME